ADPLGLEPASVADVFERERPSHVGRLEPLRRLFEQTVMEWSGHRTESMLRRYIIDLENVRRAGKRRARTAGPLTTSVPSETVAHRPLREPLQNHYTTTESSGAAGGG